MPEHEVRVVNANGPVQRLVPFPAGLQSAATQNSYAVFGFSPVLLNGFPTPGFDGAPEGAPPPALVTCTFHSVSEQPIVHPSVAELDVIAVAVCAVGFGQATGLLMVIV